MEEKLREAACFGDVEGVTTLINKGANVNGQHKINGWTALHWAAKRNNVECVDILLTSGADKTIPTSKGELPVHLTKDRIILQMFGVEVEDHPRGRQRTLSGSGPIVPNYLRHPVLNYKVDIHTNLDPKANPYRNSAAVEENGQAPHPHYSTGSLGNRKSTASLTHEPLVAAHNNTNSAGATTNGPLVAANNSSSSQGLRILKIRLVGRAEFDKDFIEVDIPIQALSFRTLIAVICEEFSISSKTISKVRKLPNTKLRRDVEIQRLTNYAELEVEIVGS